MAIGLAAVVVAGLEMDVPWRSCMRDLPRAWLITVARHQKFENPSRSSDPELVAGRKIAWRCGIAEAAATAACGGAVLTPKRLETGSTSPPRVLGPRQWIRRPGKARPLQARPNAESRPSKSRKPPNGVQPPIAANCFCLVFAPERTRPCRTARADRGGHDHIGQCATALPLPTTATRFTASLLLEFGSPSALEACSPRDAAFNVCVALGRLPHAGCISLLDHTIVCRTERRFGIGPGRRDRKVSRL